MQEFPLFKEKTLKRLCSEIEVTQKQKNASKKWIELLENDKLREEVTNYPKFMIYILQDLLGYNITAFKHEEKNMEFPFRDKAGNFLVCFEAKGTKTKDLWSSQGRTTKIRETPVNQINDYIYKNKIPYGVLTNYRIFVLFKREEGYTKFHKFDFLDNKDNPEKLKEFILVFSRESFEDNRTENIYKESIIEERDFTKQFYKLFHETRLMLIKEFQDNGANRDESIHFAQIFLNRLMFVFFAEDVDKLKKRLFEDMVLNLLKVESVFSENSRLVCNLIKSIFENLNVGSKRHNIFGFNGGLFKEQIPEKIYYKDFRKKPYFNEIYQYSSLKKEVKLDKRSKEIIDKHNGYINPITINLLYMASFDFKTEVSVNILGHIFEQSISDLEELKQEKVLRRKKEGVYYTPDYITNYICRNTIIPYLSKNEVDTVDKLIDEYFDDIQVLEKKFKNLKILDPACGSGSFLIKVVDILLEIHKQVQIVKEIKGHYTAKKVKGLSRKQKRALRDNLQLSFVKWNEEDEAREIIENNIYGVDINEESVEITKLSMFFKIARKNKKLIDLSKNIKCGNSLIEDSTVDAKPFDWNEEFKSIMNKDGFDIIIGNPPYINVESQPKIHKKFYYKRYNTVYKRYDIFGLFFEKSLSELTKKGIISYIVPSQILNNLSYTKLRDLLLNNKYLKEVCYVGDKIFEDANNDVCIITLDKSRVNNIRLINALNFNEPISIKVKPDYFKKFNNIISFSGHHSVDPIFDKIFDPDLTKISDEFDVFQGIVTGDNSIYIFNIDQLKNLSIEKELFHTVLLGRDFEKWTIRNTNRKILYIDQNTKIEKHPATIEYLKQFKEKLCDSRSASEKSTEWYCLHRPRIKSNLDKVPKILVQGTRNPRLKTRIVATIDEIGVYGLQSINFIIPLKDDESIYYLLTILNSKLINYLYQTKYLNVAIKAEYIKNTRIPVPTELQHDCAINL